LSAEIRTLRVANKALSKRRKAKKARVYEKNAFTVKDTQDLLSQKDTEKQAQRNLRTEGGRKKKGQPLIRRYSTCGETGHNARTYQDIIVVLGLLDSE
jgi:hypothetical protein